MPGIPIHPEQASTIAQGVDHLYFFLTGVTLFFTALIFALIFYFAIRYRRHSDDERPPEITGSLPLEIACIGIPSVFCAQYCGAQHSEMTGWVYVMTQADYQRWLSGLVQGESMVQAGARLYQQLGCITCHGTGRGPSFVGVYGKPVKLSTGETVTADEPYLRESILVPSAKIVAGYNALMPTFQGQVNEEQVL